MIANETTIHHSSNEVDVSNYRQLYRWSSKMREKNLYREPTIHAIPVIREITFSYFCTTVRPSILVFVHHSSHMWRHCIVSGWFTSRAVDRLKRHSKDTVKSSHTK